ncbi:MAG: hypothetical protein AVDCRST_MAG88-387, partial [uncultured Thermomicrobiales bacterium]
WAADWELRMLAASTTRSPSCPRPSRWPGCCPPRSVIERGLAQAGRLRRLIWRDQRPASAGTVLATRSSRCSRSPRRSPRPRLAASVTMSVS